MAYDEAFAHRVREQLAGEAGVTEKAMFGGLAFLLHGNMTVGVSGKGDLMVRVGPEAYDDALSQPHAQPFHMGGGRPMTGWIRVALEGLESEPQLAAWVDRALAFTRTLPPKT